MRLAALITHPVQYYTPIFRELARKSDLTVFFGHKASADDHRQSGFGVSFDWDIDLLDGYRHVFLENVSRAPGLNHFGGVDTPKIGAELRGGGFDVLLLTGWYRKSHLQALAAAKQIGLPVMVRGDSHLDTPRGWLKIAAKRAIYPHFLRRFDAALVVGKRNRAYWEHYGYPRDRMFDAPHCVDNAFFAERATPEARAVLREQVGISPDVKVVLFAGKLIPLKRPFDLINAVARLLAQGQLTHIIVAGSGPLEDEARALAQERNVPIHFLGFCNQSQMPKVYAAADVLAMCSESETWGLVVNEALASGRPALVSDAVGCAPDIAELCGPGAVFRMGDIADFSGKLRDVLFSPPSSQSLVATAARFDLGRTADCILAAAAALKAKRKELNT